MADTPNPTDFTYGLCGCLGDCSVCCITWFCPWYMIAKNKAMVDNRDCTICDCCCAMPNLEYFTRQQIRARFNIPYSVCADCLSLCICTACVICQDAREIKLRNSVAAVRR
eukprot:EC715165.1.p2 GENE.EC715165.1~~EC715165.1.p2  ORF type:complete len:111 (+),score=28.23 EC715165.1:1-333(+)